MTDPEVHAKLDALTEQVTALASAIGLPDEQVKARHGAELDRLTAAEVHRSTFATTRLATGYSIEQVDAFMDRAAEEIARLTEERDTLR